MMVHLTKQLGLIANPEQKTKTIHGRIGISISHKISTFSLIQILFLDIQMINYGCKIFYLKILTTSDELTIPSNTPSSSTTGAPLIPYFSMILVATDMSSEALT